MENKKEITMEDLAGMVKRGFDSVDKRFEGFEKSINKRFDKVDERLDKIEDRLDSIEDRLDNVEMKLEGLNRRVMFLEDKITEHSKELREIRISVQKIQEGKEGDEKNGEKIIRIEQRVDNLEMKVGESQSIK